MIKKEWIKRAKTWFLRIFFYHLYHQFALMYDLISTVVSLGRWKSWVMATIPFLQGPKILELGHGPGHLLQALQKRGLSVYGLDESQQMGYLATRRLSRKSIDVDLIRAYAQYIPIKSQSQDQVVATFPSEYISNPDTISEINRVLAPGGTFILLPFIQVTGKKLLERVSSWLFDVTDQSSDWDDRMTKPLKKEGFKTTVELISTKSWSLFIIIAKKQ